MCVWLVADCSMCVNPLYKKAVIGSFNDFIAYCNCADKYKVHKDLECHSKVNQLGETYCGAILHNELYAEKVVEKELLQSARWKIPDVREYKRQKFQPTTAAVLVPTKNPEFRCVIFGRSRVCIYFGNVTVAVYFGKVAFISGM